MEFDEIHHIGIAVNSIEKSLEYYTGFLNMVQETDIVDDPIQKVRVVLLGPKPGGSQTRIELIEELESPSPISNILKQKNRMYHFCVEVDSIDAVLEETKSNRSMVLGKPVPAKLFNNRRIVFLFTPDRYLIELLEKE